MSLIYHHDEDLYEAACDAHALLDHAGECAVKTCFFKADLTPKGAAMFLTRTLHWRFVNQGKDDYLACPDCACELERLRRQANFAAFWAKKVQPKADARAAEARERKRLGLPARRERQFRNDAKVRV